MRPDGIANLTCVAPVVTEALTQRNEFASGNVRVVVAQPPVSSVMATPATPRKPTKPNTVQSPAGTLPLPMFAADPLVRATPEPDTTLTITGCSPMSPLAPAPPRVSHDRLPVAG